jgi:hypothetical protein
MNWPLLRRTLGTYRRNVGMEEKELAVRLRVAPSTIYRIENVDKYPNHKPDMDTIAAWIRETGGTFAGFFTEIDGVLTPSLQNDVSQLHNLSGAVSSITNGRANELRAEPVAASESSDATAVSALRLVQADLANLPQEVAHALGHTFSKVGAELTAVGLKLLATRTRAKAPKSRPKVPKVRGAKPGSSRGRTGTGR